MIRERRPQRLDRRGRRAAGFTALAGGVLVILVAVLVVTGPSFLASDSDPDESVPSPDASATDTSDAPVANPEHTLEKTYIEADVGFPGTLNPLLAETLSERSVASLLFRGLLQHDNNGDPRPDLASEWSVSEDGQRYEVVLDRGIRWHDGEPIRVEDVLFTISLVQDPEFPGHAAISRFWRGITASKVDEETIAFELKEPYAGFPNYLTLPILPKHVFGGELATDLTGQDLSWTAVGTGPFALDEVSYEQRELRFVATPSSGIDSNLEEVVIRYFESRDEALESFREGEVDGVASVPLEALESAESLPPGARLYAPPLPGYTALFFNLRHPLYRDQETRRAIEFGIDREQLIETVFAGHAIAGSSPVPQMLSAHHPGDHANYDPDRARDLLEAAGWTFDEEEQTLQREGERLVFPLLVDQDDAQRLSVANALREQLQQIGVIVEVQGVTATELQQALADRHFSTALFGWHTESGDPDCFQMWHSSQAEEGMNFTGFAHTDADEALVAARHSVALKERNQHYAEFQRIFAEQVPAVVLFYPRYHFAVSARVDGAEPESLVNPSDRMRQVPNWHVRETR